MMVENIEGFAGFTKRNRRSCEIFLRKAWENLGATVLAKISNKQVLQHQFAECCSLVKFEKFLKNF